MNHADLLIEIGTEELPPKPLQTLSSAFGTALRAGLERSGLTHGEIELHATPRRLACLVRELVDMQPDRETIRRGPAVTAAFDEDGNPTKAALGFAASCGVPVDALETTGNEKGSWLCFRFKEQGKPTVQLIPDIVRQALGALPIPKRMRWGKGSVEFVRPVHWVVLLFGRTIIEADILGMRAGRTTLGHRFHCPEPLSLEQASDYAEVLETRGKVITDFAARRARILHQVHAEAAACGGTAVIEAALLDEVTGLVEWPCALAGSFDARFLSLPPEVLVATMRDHQKYFHVVDAAGRLVPHFIAVANIESRDPAIVRAGNERVIRPRLTDAAFFWEQDTKKPLEDRLEELKQVVFQEKLGTLYDKTLRVAALAERIANSIGADPAQARRAAMLSRCDLMTGMVGEFPELQGVMGRYYAECSGEAPEVCLALDELYLPRFSGDRLPLSGVGQALALADRLDTLVGIFAIGEAPTGDKDPFGLRRAALGSLRIMVECALDLDLEELLRHAASGYGSMVPATDVLDEVFDFMMERLRGYHYEAGTAADVFDAVAARRPTSPLDFDKRVRAVAQFRELPAAASLASANKRSGNILKKTTEAVAETVSSKLLAEPEERALAAALDEVERAIAPSLEQRDYADALSQLATLRAPIDAFFDSVLVMAEDDALRRNRLALLSRLHKLFLRVADISRLQSASARED